MRKIDINNPWDITFPLERKIYDDSTIVYHGTSSIFVSKIEDEGWVINKQSYSIDDIKFVCKVYESIGYSNSFGYAVIRSCTLGINNYKVRKKSGSFTQNYWYARNYAINPGGETIKNLIATIDDFIRLIDNHDLLLEHAQKLEQELSKLPPNIDYRNTLKSCLRKIRNDIYLKDVSSKLRALKVKYENIIKDRYPVVYAVKVEPQWFENWMEPIKIGDYMEIKAIDLHAKVSILPENIVVRINFPNGAVRFQPYANQPMPVRWDIDNFKKWLLEHKEEPELKEFVKKCPCIRDI